MGRHKGKGGAKGGGETTDAADPFEQLDMCVAVLQDKSGSTREAAMSALGGALEALPPLDELNSRCLAIFALCGVSVKKGSPKEARLAYRTVGLLALTLRDGGAPGLLDESFPMLSRALRVQASHDDVPTLVAGLDCLAVVTFAGAVDAEEAERSLKAIWGVIFPPSSRSAKLSAGARALKTSHQLLAAAVSAWTFLLTTVAITDAQRKAERGAWNATVASLAGLLEDDDRTVRMAAGEALAVCVELNLTQHAPRKDMEALAAKVSDLASEAGGKGVSKTLLPEQRDLFRQIAAFLDHGERPRKTMRTTSDRGSVLRVSTWAKLVQLNFLRRFLGGGFLKHVQGNALFKEAFTVGADESKMLSIAKKRQGSKAKEMMMKVKRDTAWEAKNVFCLSQDAALQGRKPENLLQHGWH